MRGKIKFTLYLWKNNQGFTFVEMLTALFIVSLASVLLLSSIKLVKTFQTHDYHDKKIEWYTFCLYMENQISKEYFEQCEPDRLVTKQGNQTIYYERYKNSIRRTTDKGGHEPLLTNVKQWALFQGDDYIVMQVELESGEIYSHALFMGKKKKDISSREHFSGNDSQRFSYVTLFKNGNNSLSF